MKHARLTKAEMQRAIKAHIASGLPVAGTELRPDGAFVIHAELDKEAKKPLPIDAPEQWDE